MARRKVTGRELAGALGWSVTTTWRRLNGSHPFNVDELAAVAAYLNIPISDLLPEREAA